MQKLHEVQDLKHSALFPAVHIQCSANLIGGGGGGFRTTEMSKCWAEVVGGDGVGGWDR